MIHSPTWTIEAEKFWSEVRIALRANRETADQAEELVEAYRAALAVHGVSEGLVFHRGAAADAAKLQQRELAKA